MSRAAGRSMKTQRQTTSALACGLDLSVDRPHQGSTYLCNGNGKFPAEIERATVWGPRRGDTVA